MCVKCGALALTGSWGSSKYMQTYYGVSDAQSAASGFARHDAGAGIYAWSIDLDWNHKLTARWSVLAAAGVTQLTGEAGDNPIVQRKTSPTGSLKVTYLISLIPETAEQRYILSLPLVSSVTPI